MHGEVYSGSIVIDVLSRQREETRRGTHDTERRPGYLNWNRDSGCGGREFKRIKELEPTHEGYS